MTFSKNPASRNFTLAQEGDSYVARLRTTTRTLNGMPNLLTAPGSATTDLAHVVFTRDALGSVKFYVDGVLSSTDFMGGSVSNWDSSHKFALANEITENRPWLGEMHLAAVYKKALSSSEVLQNYAAGANRTVVLNEFLPNPDGFEYGFDFGSDSSDMPQGEWVELYNTSSDPVDLTGWYIWDASGSATNKIAITSANTDLGTTVIPGFGWLVVYMNKAVLNNSGDTVKLLNASDIVIDEYTYDLSGACDLEPTARGDTNDKTESGTCNSTVPGNKSYARIPDGLGAFVDPIPTPGGVNIVENSIEEPPLYEPETQTQNGVFTASPLAIEDEPTLIEEEQQTGTTTPEVEEEKIVEPEATTTENIIIESAATTTKEVIEPIATTTEEIIEQPIVVATTTREQSPTEETNLSTDSINQEQATTTEENAIIPQTQEEEPLEPKREPPIQEPEEALIVKEEDLIEEKKEEPPISLVEDTIKPEIQNSDG